MILNISNRLDAFIERIGQISSWFIFILVLQVSADVLFRYFFHISSIAEPRVTMAYLAIIAMIGSAYTFQQGEHVRVDLFYAHYSEKVKQWMDYYHPCFYNHTLFTFYNIFIKRVCNAVLYNRGSLSGSWRFTL